jgi:hypothetical protein
MKNESNKNLKAFSVDMFHSEKEMTINPAWVVTFVRWSNRDSRKIKGIPPLKSEDPMIVSSDCVSITVTDSKSSPTPAAQINLKMGTYNYLTAIAPGDYVFINLLDYEKDASRVTEKIKNNKPINEEDDGFKGFFKVQSVRKVMSMDPKTGSKTVMCVVQAYAFTELNNTIYFNPRLATGEAKNDFLFLTEISDKWNQLVKNKKSPSVQELVATIYSMFVGIGAPERSAKKIKTGILKNYNEHFFVPSTVGALLGTNSNSNGIKVQDVYNLLFGVQQYAPTSNSLEVGLNPTGLQISNLMPRLFVTPKNCEGISYIQAEYWHQVTAFSLMQNYLNSPINELYTTFKLDLNKKVMPTVVMRQIPFSSPTYNEGKVTKFLNLPRWRLNTEFIYSMNIGREESARVNFVQGYGRLSMAGDKAESHAAMQLAEENYVYDADDIKKNGLRPQQFASNFDMFTGEGSKDTFLSKRWTRLVADALLGGHLKLNGSITVPGVMKPMSVGDNLQIGEVVYHIESVTHNSSISPSSGERSFQTTIELSHGVVDSDDYYAEMSNSLVQEQQAQEYQLYDFLGGPIDPTISKDSTEKQEEKNIRFIPPTVVREGFKGSGSGGTVA